MLNDLLTNLFGIQLKKRHLDFAFIVHPRYTSDIYKKYRWLRILPDFIVEWFLFIFFPTYGGGIYNVKNKKGETLRGGLIICPLVSKQMLGHRKWAKRKVVQSVRLAERYGAKVVGLGALTSSVTGGGEEISGRFQNITLTSGNSLTTFITADDVSRMIKSNNLTGTIVILGATGSIGRGVTEILATSLPNEIICVGKTPHKVSELVAYLKNLKNIQSENITGSVSVDTYRKATAIVVTTSAHDAILHRHLLGQDLRLIYDVTQPKNTPEDVQNMRDALFIDGGLIKLPEEIKITLDIGLPKGIAYSCLSETILLSAELENGKKSGSKISIDFVKEIGEAAKKRNFVSHLIYHDNSTTKLSI